LLCFAGSPDLTLPWLQLLTRCHALADSFEQQSREARIITSAEQTLPFVPADAAAEPQGRVAAMAAALLSFGIALPVQLQSLYNLAVAEFTFWERVPVAASPLVTAASTVVQQMRHQSHADVRPQHHTLQQQQQQQQHGTLRHPHAAQQQHRQNEQQGQQQQQSSGAGLAERVDGICSTLHWLHADRLLQVTPGSWPQHLAQHLLHNGSTDSSSSATAAGSSSDGSTSSMLLVADQACDWCSGPLQQQQQQQSVTPAAVNAAAGAAGLRGTTGISSSSSSSSSVGLLGCPSCGAAQYCSRVCADAAKPVHYANCW
jgi:hypothetical protein